MNCLCTVTLLDCSAYMWLRMMSGLSAGGLFVYLYRVNSTTHLVVPHSIPGTEHVLSLGAALYDWSIWLHWLELLAIHCFAPSPNRILTSWFSGVNLWKLCYMMTAANICIFEVCPTDIHICIETGLSVTSHVLCPVAQNTNYGETNM